MCIQEELVYLTFTKSSCVLNPVGTGIQSSFICIRTWSVSYEKISSNDQMAIGAIKAIKSYGRSVPDDIAVVGFDNLSVSSLIVRRSSCEGAANEWDLGRELKLKGLIYAVSADLKFLHGESLSLSLLRFS